MSFSGKHPIGVTDSTAWPVLPTTGDEADNYMAGRLKTLEAGAGTGGFTFVRKTADETVTTSTALQDDNELFFPIAANETWVSDWVLCVDGATGGDFKLAFNVPAGATGRYFSLAYDAGVTTPQGAIVSNGSTDLTDTGAVTRGTLGGGVVSTEYVRLIVVNGSTAGIVRLRWAQGTSSGTASTLFTNSYVRAERVSPIQPAGANYGAMQLVSRQVLAAAATSITFTGLDLNADSTYIARFGLKNASGSANTISAFYNADTTATNYHRQRLDAQGTSVTPGTAQANDAVLIILDASAYAAGEAKVMKTATGDGSARAQSFNTHGTGLGTGAGGTKLQHIIQVWNTTGQNVTQIAFTGNQASGLATGSFIELYRLAPVQMARSSYAVYASANQAKASDTALADDDALKVTLTAGKKYAIQMQVGFLTNTTADLKHDFNFTGTAAGFSCLRTVHDTYPSVGSGASGTAGGRKWDTALNTVTTYNFSGDPAEMLMFSIGIEATTGGTFSFRWAQNTSNVGATTRQRDAWMSVVEIP